MRKHLHIDLATRSVRQEAICGEDIVKAGRYLIAKTLLESGVATVDPLSPANPLIFSAGPFAGTTFSNGNRISVGCKSPLTGGIKEANSGGTFAFALGQLLLAGLSLHNSSETWVVVRIRKDGSVTFDSAADYLAKGNYECAALLRDTYGTKVSIALCGPVGEYLGLIAGIAFTDREGRPGRLAARGGVGAVMGSKRVKAIVVDMDKTPELHDRPKFLEESRRYAKKLEDHAATGNFRKYGTAGMADLLNYIGGLTIRNFSNGQLVCPPTEVPTIGGEYLYRVMTERQVDTKHSCMPGCVVQCSNVYVDKQRKELVSPLEYETLGMMGVNCGFADPDDIARVNYIANDLGVDTIEAGATVAILMDAGFGEFGDCGFMNAALEDMRAGNERGRLLAQGAARVGRHFGVKRVPAVKDQAMSAYDPRVVKITGISMMTSAQGADHTAGNNPWADIKDKTVEQLVAISYNTQRTCAISDSLGLCIMGKATDTNFDLIASAINACHGTQVDAGFLEAIGPETLRLESAFNRAAGFTPADDKLPAFFLEEPLPPTNRVAAFADGRIGELMSALVDQGGPR